MKALLSRLAGLAMLGLTPLVANAQDYRLELINNSGLSPSEYTIYAMGFSYSSSLVLGPNGTFQSQTSGTVSSYPVGTGANQISSIVLDSSVAFTGGRIYFFVVPVGQAAPSVPFNTQPTNPPDAAFPPYTIVEITVPAGSPATVDVQTVDGFVFPITVTLNGQTNVAGQQYGQPIYSSSQTAKVNREAIFTSFNQFMQAEGTAGTPYLDLVYGAGSINGQPGGILNPFAYLSATDSSGEYVNLSSPLHTVFNSALQTLFSTATLRIQGVASGASDSGTPINPQPYNAAVVDRVYPGTSVSLPALEFTGVNDSDDVFTVFSPLGIAVLTNNAGEEITGSIVNGVLTLDSPASAVEMGMYVDGAGLVSSNGKSTTVISAINGNQLTLDPAPSGTPAPNSQYRFCRLPYLAMFQTPGQMVFGNSGVFADNTIQFASGSASATVLGSIENFIVSALNRGVALNATALNPPSNGETSQIWGDQRNWYPSGATQNLFSLFMHVGTADGDPIFFRPLNAASWPNARGQVMGSAYGFAFDENGGPVPPAPSGQPEVPSKFDQNVPVGATLQITFGPWTSESDEKPSVKIDGKKTIKTDKKTVKVKGTAVGDKLFVKYKKKPGKVVTKRVKIKPNGKWVFKLKPNTKKTILKFFAEDGSSDRSKVEKVKIIDKRFD